MLQNAIAMGKPVRVRVGEGAQVQAEPEAVDYFMVGRYRGAADLTAGSKFLQEDVIEVAGTKVTCYVVTVSPVVRRKSVRTKIRSSNVL
jgi:hypothetical protein